ncbi:hypothetical protein ACWGI8_13025 [Streptomyces sp. NPDC054841]
MSDAPVNPGEVPVFTGNLEVLDQKIKALSGAGGKITTAAGDVHTTFGGLRAFYKAPEAEQLFATTQPVKDKAATLSSDLGVIAGALSTYASDVRPLKAKLDQLRQDAVDFRDEVSKDDKWREDGDLIEENLDRRNEIAEVWTQFQAAERACHAKIVALVGGDPLKVDDGSHKEGMYGYDAEMLKQAESLPWGDAVEESTPAWQVWEHAGDFLEGFFVDGVWGTIKGLGTLVGVDGWDAAGQAWTGLGKLLTGIAITVTPVVGAAYMAMPDDKLPGWLRESRTAMKETGKALLAWDQWGSKPGRAAGAVTFNVLTTVFTGGAGGAASGAGKVGAAAKALSFAGKAGRAVDPMTYVFKGAGAGVSKIGDVMAALKGMGKVEVPQISDGAFSMPEGSLKLPDGTIQLPKGAAVPEGAIKLPDGNIKLPEGTTILPPNTVKTPFDDSPAKYTDIKGNLYGEDGSLLQRAEDAPKGKPANPTTGADNPRVDTPARQEAPVLAGVGGRGDDAVRLGDSFGNDLGDIGRVGDETPAGGTFDRTPGGGANHLPGGGVGDNMPVGRVGDNAPGGGVGDRMPTNNLDNAAGGGGRTGDNAPTGGAGHSEGPSTGGGGRDVPGGSTVDNGVPGGSTADNGVPGGGHPETPGGGGLDDLGDGADDSARVGDEAAHRAEYEAAREKPASERTPAERAAITREHVRLANEDPVWRAEHYDKWGLGKRNSSTELVDGQTLPKLVEKPGGGWMAADDLPYANPETYHLEDLVRGRDTVDPQGLKHLDDVSAKRVAGMDLTNARKDFDDIPTDETAKALADAQKHFDETVGAGVSNNSKLGEALGEEAARQHMLLQREFEGAKEVDDPPLPETPNGSKRFDQLWRDKDGNLIIVEAKGPSARLDWRQGNGAIDSGTMVKQGTIEYVRTILADMEQRAIMSPDDAKYAKEIRAAIKNKTLQYVLVQASENTGKYAGAELKHFKLF